MFIGRDSFRKTRHFHVPHNWLHVSTVDVHVQLRLLNKRQHGHSRCRVQLLVVVSADGQIRENDTERSHVRYHEVEDALLPDCLRIFRCVPRNVYQGKWFQTKNFKFYSKSINVILYFVDYFIWSWIYWTMKWISKSDIIILILHLRRIIM